MEIGEQDIGGPKSVAWRNEERGLAAKSLKAAIFVRRGFERPQGSSADSYNPPAGVLGDVGEKAGVGSRFDSALQQDLNNFARMVDQAPPGALDPTSSNYLFHSGSAAAKGTTTSRQDATMGDEQNIRRSSATTDSYSNTVGTSKDRPVLDEDIINEPTRTGSTKYNQDVMGGPDASTAQPVMPPDRDLGSKRE